MRVSKIVAGALLALLMTAGPALAVQRWGRVESVDARFHSLVIVQDGNKRHFGGRINPDTVVVFRDGRTKPGSLVDLQQLKGQRVYAIVEENAEHYVTKLWLRPDLPPSLDPVNPGAGATHPRRAGLPVPTEESSVPSPEVKKPTEEETP